MNPDSLAEQLHKKSKKLNQLTEQVERSRRTGRFYNLSLQTRQYLYRKIRNLQKRIASLQLRVKWAVATGGLSLLLAADPAQGQNTFGPFNEMARAFNPLASPLPFMQPSVGTFDYQSDGDLDLVVGEQLGYVHLVLNEGTATEPRFTYVEYENNPFRDIVLGDTYGKPAFTDFDGDGDDDFFIGTGSGGQIRYFANDNGTFVEQLQPWGTPGELTGNPMRKVGYFPPGFATVTPVDLNNDGHIDIVLSSEGDVPRVFRNDGTGNLFAHTTAGELLPGNPIGDFANFVDWDRDGDLDLITSVYTYDFPSSSSYVRIKYYRNEAGNFAEQSGMWNEHTKTGNPFNQYTDNYLLRLAIHVADLNGDGHPDLIAGTAPGTFGTRVGHRAIDYYKNTGNGHVEKREYLTNPMYGYLTGSQAAPSFGDLDGDGDLDVIVGSNNPGMEGWIDYIENENGQYIWHQEEGEFSNNPFSPVNLNGLDIGRDVTPTFVDADRDGDADVLASSSDPSARLSYFKNTSGSFDHVPFAASPFKDLDLYDDLEDTRADFGDLDGDGDVDLVIGTQLGGFGPYVVLFFKNFQVEEGLQEPHFDDVEENPFGFVSEEYALSPRLVDVDGDDDLDLIIGEHGSNDDGMDGNEVIFLENTGTPESPVFEFRTDNFFQTPTPDGNPRNPGLTFLDYDGDGDLDTFIGNNNGEISYFRNNNPAPQLAVAEAVPFAYGESVTIDPDMVVTDIDNDRIIRVTIAIENFEPGHETLVAGNLPEGITAHFQNGTLTLTGPASVANFQEALRGVRYQYSEAGVSSSAAKKIAPPSAARTISRSLTLSVLDIDRTRATGNIKTITLTHTNHAPVLSPSVVTTTYQNAPVALSSLFALADDDDTQLASASIQFTGGTYVAGEDLLQATVPTGLTQTFNLTTGELSVSGAASVAQYQNVLRSIRYSNLSSTPTQQNRTIRIRVADLEDNSNPADVTVVVSPASTPALGGSTFNFTYHSGSLHILPDVEVTDADNQITSAQVAFQSGFVAGDELVFTNQNGITGSFSAAGVLTLTGAATVANYQLALRSIIYQHTAADKISGPRTLTVTAHDGTTASNTLTIGLTVSNEAPTLTLSVADRTFIGTDLSLDSDLSVADTDHVNIASATIAFTSGFVAGEDELIFVNQNGITGNFDVPSGTLTLNGSASVANYQSALRAVTYRNAAADRSNGNRIVQWRVSDGTSSSVPVSLTLQVPNQAPVATITTHTHTFTAGGVAIAPDLSIADSDDAFTQSAEIHITNGYLSSEDALVFASQNGISGNFDATTGTLSLSGQASKADYQAALRSIQYQNNATNRTPGNRALTVRVSDGQATSNVLGLTVNVVNTAPVISGNGPALFYLSGELVVHNTLVLNDSDNTHLQSAAVMIQSGLQEAEDELLFTSQSGITGSYQAGILQLTGNATVLEYQEALRTVRYRNQSAAPATHDRIISFLVNDGHQISNLLQVSVTVNKPPVVAAEPQLTQAGGNVSLSLSQILSDPDNNLDLSTLVITSQQGAAITRVDDVVVIDYARVANFQGVDQLTIQVCDAAGRCATQTIDIQVEADMIVYNGVSPNGDQANDFFKIRFLPAGSRVSIFNRWGDVVFSQSNYDQEDVNKRFSGLNQSGQELSAGSYFYKIETPQGRTVTGYLTLKR
ncbi:MAG: FG-GAP-like repeat-containing protein [Bacteroidota bacterium]